LSLFLCLCLCFCVFVFLLFVVLVTPKRHHALLQIPERHETKESRFRGAPRGGGSMLRSWEKNLDT
jgi:hypothetical protein